MKKLVSLVLVCLLVLACTTAMAQQEPKKAVLVMRTLSDTFAATFANQLLTQAEVYKDTFTMEVLDAQGDAEKANSLIENCITKGYDCVIICPVDSELQRPYAEKVIAAGIFCITTSAKINNLEGGSTVDADPYNQGVMLAEEAIKQVPQNGRAVIMNCLPGNAHTTARMRAIEEVFVAGRPDVEVLATKVLEHASEAEAMALMEDWVQAYGKIDAVLATADAVGLGAREAVKDDPNFDKLQIYSVDGLSAAVQAIVDGTYTATVFQDASQLAANNLKATYLLLSGEKAQVDLVYADKLVNAENAAEVLPVAN